MLKFDVIVGNPPFQPPTTRTGGIGSGAKIWQKFVEIGFKILNDDGWFAFVTPFNWRMGKSRMIKDAQELMWNNNIIDVQPANKYFSVGGNIAIDYWIITKDKDVKGIEINPILKENRLYFLADKETFLEFIQDQKKSEDNFILNAGFNDERRYDSIKKSKKGDDIHKYPHLNTMSQYNNGYYDWYSEKTKGFDNPKVLVSDSGNLNDFVLFDNGQIGGGHHTGIFLVDSKEEGKKLENFLKHSKIIKNIIKNTSGGGFGLNLSFIRKIPKSWVERFNNGEDL